MSGDGERCASAAPGVNTPQESALLECEVRRVIGALAPYGVLQRDALANACGARRWSAGEFRVALEAAVRDGRLRRLPLGFYALRGTAQSDAADQNVFFDGKERS